MIGKLIRRISALFGRKKKVPGPTIKVKQRPVWMQKKKEATQAAAKAKATMKKVAPAITFGDRKKARLFHGCPRCKLAGKLTFPTSGRTRRGLAVRCPVCKFTMVEKTGKATQREWNKRSEHSSRQIAAGC